ncbi:MAG: YIP1 family protein [Defluviitaleaceae bacterium]|nr:YIP1 family protein [Defluviitaleaceae bacterium]
MTKTSLGNQSRFDFDRYVKSLRYSLFVIRKPLAGYWDLIHEGYGTMAAAHTIVAVAIIVQILRITLTNFQFMWFNPEMFNVVIVMLQILLPLLLWVVANWSLTTLFDGKGKLSDIYMGTAYALTPLIIIDAALIPMSHVITFEEGQIYWMLTSLAGLWFVLLVLCAMKEIHDYSFGKAIATSVISIIVIGIIMFIFIMFFAVVSDGIAYFVSIIQELAFRFDLSLGFN